MHVAQIGEEVRRIYLIGICGTAMASLAGMLKRSGFEVSGSDEHVYPPMSTYLADLGIEILEGYTAENLEKVGPDIVVVGNAAAKTNPEAAWVLDKDLPFTSMPEAIYQLFIKGKHSIVVSGTHGKTTTTSLMAWTLESAGRDPSLVVGGIPSNFGQNFKLGEGADFVIEGDEYNTAFFDKGPKFIHYRADSLIVNNIEFDHADIYDNLDAILRSFRIVIENVEPRGLIVANGDDENVTSLRSAARAEWRTFGFGEENRVRAVDVEYGPEVTRFEVVSGGRRVGTFDLPISGPHNVLNALAIFAVAEARGLDPDEIRRGFATFEGIKRRMEIRGVERGITVIDDFAHHPTAIDTTLQGARDRYPDRTIWALFEPRSISSSRKEFEDAYKKAFRHADRVLIAPVFHRKRYETRYGLDKMMSVDAVVAALEKRGVRSTAFETFDPMVETVYREGAEGDVVILMSSGAFDGLHEKILDRLRG